MNSKITVHNVYEIIKRNPSGISSHAIMLQLIGVGGTIEDLASIRALLASMTMAGTLTVERKTTPFSVYALRDETPDEEIDEPTLTSTWRLVSGATPPTPGKTYIFLTATDTETFAGVFVGWIDKKEAAAGDMRYVHTMTGILHRNDSLMYTEIPKRSPEQNC